MDGSVATHGETAAACFCEIAAAVARTFAGAFASTSLGRPRFCAAIVGLDVKKERIVPFELEARFSVDDAATAEAHVPRAGLGGNP